MTAPVAPVTMSRPGLPLPYVQNLEICTPELWLSPCVFTCKTLVHLTLHNCSSIPSHGASFPLLKSLQLYSSLDLVQESLPHLLSGCPVLEELTIGGVRDRMLDCLVIASATIQRLQLDVTCHYPMVEINAPALRILRIEHGSSYDRISISPETSLFDADIWVHNFREFYDQFVNNLTNVQSLRLSVGEFLSTPSVGEDNHNIAAVPRSFVRFNNMTKLELYADCILLLRFLGMADNVGVLIFCQVHKNMKRLMEPRKVPKCLLTHLKTIKMEEFGSTENEFSMVRYLLQHARVLERMSIDSRHDGTDFKQRFDDLKRISSFERGSKSCVVVFNEVSFGVESSRLLSLV